MEIRPCSRDGFHPLLCSEACLPLIPVVCQHFLDSLKSRSLWNECHSTYTYSLMLQNNVSAHESWLLKFEIKKQNPMKHLTFKYESWGVGGRECFRSIKVLESRSLIFLNFLKFCQTTLHVHGETVKIKWLWSSVLKLFIGLCSCKEFLLRENWWHLHDTTWMSHLNSVMWKAC